MPDEPPKKKISQLTFRTLDELVSSDNTYIPVDLKLEDDSVVTRYIHPMDIISLTITETLISKADLDGNGKVPPEQLPSYVDDVLEFNDLAAFPSPGTASILYVAKDTNQQYRWSGSAYIPLGSTAQIASDADAVSGTDNTKLMTPLRTRASINAVVPIASSGARGKVYGGYDSVRDKPLFGFTNTGEHNYQRVFGRLCHGWRFLSDDITASNNYFNFALVPGDMTLPIILPMDLRVEALVIAFDDGYKVLDDGYDEAFYITAELSYLDTPGSVFAGSGIVNLATPDAKRSVVIRDSSLPTLDGGRSLRIEVNLNAEGYEGQAPHLTGMSIYLVGYYGGDTTFGF